jgi:hypothetical protein
MPTVSDPTILDDVAKAAAAGSGVGGGFFALRWVVLWLTARFDRRQALLDAEHDALDMSWKEYRQLLERRLGALEKANEALRLSFQHVSAGLIRIDPQNPALLIAERIMAAAFPTDFSMAASMAQAALDEDDRRGKQP